MLPRRQLRRLNEAVGVLLWGLACLGLVWVAVILLKSCLHIREAGA